MALLHKCIHGFGEEKRLDSQSGTLCVQEKETSQDVIGIRVKRQRYRKLTIAKISKLKKQLGK